MKQKCMKYISMKIANTKWTSTDIQLSWKELLIAQYKQSTNVEFVIW